MSFKVFLLTILQAIAIVSSVERENIFQTEGSCRPLPPENRRVGNFGRDEHENTKEWWSRSAKVSHEFVHKLDSNNFEKFRLDHPNSLIMFYAKWCYYSQICTPQFSNAAEQLQRSKYPGAMGALDCDEAKLLCQQYEIKSFPTFLYFPKGSNQGEKYSFERKANEFVSFMVGKSLSSRKMPLKMF